MALEIPARGRAHEALWTLAAGAVVVAFCLLLLWQDPGFFFRDDNQTEHIATMADVARAWRAGEWPLVSPYTWYSGDLGGEYQFGLFNVVGQLLNLLAWAFTASPAAAAAVLGTGHLAIMGMGVFRVARERGQALPYAMLATIAGTLSGWNMVWAAAGWLPQLTAFTWVPWIWWGLQRALRPDAPRLRWVPAGLAVYLLLSAGLPFTVLLGLLVSAWLAIEAMAGRGLRAAAPAVAAWAFGGLLASPAWLLLLEYGRATSRPAMGLAPGFQYVMPGSMVLGLFYPAYAAVYNVWELYAAHFALEFACGVVPAIALVAVLVRDRAGFARPQAWTLGLLAVVWLLSIYPSPGVFRWSFRWVELFMLVLGVLGAEALAAWDARAEGRRGLLALWALAAMLFVASRRWAMALPVALSGGGHVDEGRFVLALAALLLGWAVAAYALRAREARVWVAPAVALLVLWLGYVRLPIQQTTPTWNVHPQVMQVAPFEASRVYFNLSTFMDVWAFAGTRAPVGIVNRFSNFGCYGGVRLLNGYSPLGLVGFKRLFDLELHGCPSPEAVERLVKREAGPDGLLALVGVHGLILPPTSPHLATLQAQGWALHAGAPDGFLLHRTGAGAPLPRALTRVVYAPDAESLVGALLERPAGPAPAMLVAAPGEPVAAAREFGPCVVTPVAQTRSRTIVDVAASPDRPAMVLFPQPWYPGLRAELDGRPLAVRAIDMLVAGVELPAGARGRVTLVYAPQALPLGAGLAALGAIGLPLVWGRRRRRE